MQTTIDHHYDADVETVFALITDPGFIEAKYVALGGKDVSVERTETSGTIEVVTTRTVTVDLPGFAKKVLAPTQTAVQVERWGDADASGVRSCNYEVDIKGAPSKVSGAHTLSAAGTGTDHHLVLEVKVSVPLIGGKLEKFASESARAEIAEQFVYTDQELAG